MSDAQKSETRTLPCPDCGSPVIDDGELCYDSHGMPGGITEVTSASDLQFSCNCDLECDQLDALYEAFEEAWSKPPEKVFPYMVHPDEDLTEKFAALSPPTPERKVDGKTLSEAICETIESFDLGEIPDVLPVGEDDWPMKGFVREKDGQLTLKIMDGRDNFEGLEYSIVPTEGYRIIREEDVPVIVRLLRAALESQGGVGMDHEAGLLDQLTNTEGRP